MAEKRLKNKWRCVFAYKSEVYVLYRYAYTRKQAWYQCCRALSHTHNVLVGMVMERFNYEKNNDFEIEIELEIKEVD